MGLKLGFLPFSEGCIISFPWYCTRLQLGITSSRAETSPKKIFAAEIGAKMIFFILMLSNVHSNLLVLDLSIILNIFCTLHQQEGPMNSCSTVHQSVYPSVHLTSFSQGVFFDFLHDDSHEYRRIVQPDFWKKSYSLCASKYIII